MGLDVKVLSKKTVWDLVTGDSRVSDFTILATAATTIGELDVRAFPTWWPSSRACAGKNGP